MKRSANIRLLLLGSVSAGALGGCGGAPTGEPRVSPESVYGNDYYIEGAGYYHAPFRAFYPQRYNAYDAARRQYYYGGTWGPAPFRSIVNVSSPTADAAQAAEAGRAAIVRGGFGGTSHSYHVWS